LTWLQCIELLSIRHIKAAILTRKSVDSRCFLAVLCSRCKFFRPFPVVLFSGSREGKNGNEEAVNIAALRRERGVSEKVLGGN
jgi:hypothetical protein